MFPCDIESIDKRWKVGEPSCFMERGKTADQRSHNEIIIIPSYVHSVCTCVAVQLSGCLVAVTSSQYYVLVLQCTYFFEYFYFYYDYDSTVHSTLLLLAYITTYIIIYYLYIIRSTTYKILSQQYQYQQYILYQLYNLCIITYNYYISYYILLSCSAIISHTSTSSQL